MFWAISPIGTGCIWGREPHCTSEADQHQGSRSAWTKGTADGLMDSISWLRIGCLTWLQHLWVPQDQRRWDGEDFEQDNSLYFWHASSELQFVYHHQINRSKKTARFDSADSSNTLFSTTCSSLSKRMKKHMITLADSSITFTRY